MPAAQASDVRDYARRNRLNVSTAVRVLLDRALHQESAVEQVALASLVAAEHALLLIASVFPDGDRRMREQAEAAVQAAERRLASLADRLGEEASSRG